MSNATFGTPLDYETLLTRLPAKDRLNVQRHIAGCEVDPVHAELFKRIACVLMSLAPHTAKTFGQQAMQFFIPDGKYRRQVFAIHDQRDGKINIYMDDVLPEALSAGIVTGPMEIAGQPSYRIRDSIDSLMIETLDAHSSDPAPFYKGLVGWNRRAIRIGLPTSATELQISTVEALATLSASRWTVVAATT